jgi:hypothetical protein
VIGAALLAALGTIASAETLPSSGEFEGVYHRDRWGVGRFAYWIVPPELHDYLKEFENRRIKLHVLKADEQESPGRGMIRRVGEVEVLEASPLDFELRTEVQWNRNQRELETTFFLINRSETPIDVSLHDVVMGVRSEAGQSDSARADIFDEQTRSQVRTTSQGLQWLNNHFALANESFEQGHHLKIRPKERFPIVARIPISLGQHEVSITGRPSVGDNWKPPKSSWFRISVSEEAKPSERKSQLKIDDMQWKMSTNPFGAPVLRLSFTLKRPADQDRAAAVCTRRDRVLMAGTIAGVDETGSVRKLETDPCYDCSNRGEPWQLKPIPPEGFSTAIDIRERQVLLGRAELRQVRLELLTDQGLEAFTVPGPPMGVVPPQQLP